jgi:hypothetical protein
MKRIALAVILAAALSGCSLSAMVALVKPSPSPTPTTPRLEQVALACGVGPRIQDKGGSLSLDTQGKLDTTGDDLTVVVCVLSKTGAPSFVTDHIDSTRALDGTQSDEWDGYRARWTYHPDAGLRITFIDTRIAS